MLTMLATSSMRPTVSHTNTGQTPQRHRSRFQIMFEPKEPLLARGQEERLRAGYRAMVARHDRGAEKKYHQEHRQYVEICHTPFHSGKLFSKSRSIIDDDS